MKMKTVLKNLDRIDASSIPNRRLSRRVSRLQQKRKQGGFTLLELLVVVAILAAIAGTAVIALQDTDARASAAAHVAMMDELDKAVREYRVLNKNQYPDRFDSIMETNAAIAGGTITTGTALLGQAAIEDIVPMALSEVTHPDDTAAGDVMVSRLNDIGITTLRVASTDAATANPDGDGDCSDMEALIASRGNAVVAGNLFLSPEANGCGADHTIDTSTNVMVWVGGTERITGEPVAADFSDADANGTITAAADAVNAGNPVFMAVGFGPSSTLFDVRNLGGMSTVPVYRHVSETEYNRFVGLFHIANVEAAGNFTPVDQVLLVGVVDGAGDTKEEELGEWDGTRNTI